MKKLFMLSLSVSIGVTAFASNPGRFEYYVNTIYQDGTSWMSFPQGGDGKIVLGDVEFQNNGEAIGGYGVEFQVNVAGGPSSPGSSGTLLIARELDVNAYAKYVPLDDEAPVGPFYISVLQGKATLLGASGLDWTAGGYAEITHNEETLVGAISDFNPLLQTSFGFSRSGFTVQFTHDQESTVPVGGIFQRSNGDWVVTTIPEFTEHTSRIFWDVPTERSMSATLQAYKISKVTYVDGQQLSHGWIPEDIDADGEVGSGDFSRLAAAWDSVVGDQNYDLWADINQDGEVGSADFSMLSSKWDLPYTFGVEVLGLSTTMDAPITP